MRDARSRRSTGAALLGALLSGLSGCSLVGNSNTSIGLWSVADLEEGLSALAAEASTDQVVEFRASPYALHLTLLPTAGEAEYLKWTGWEGEVTREDGVGGYGYPQAAATGTVALGDIDLEFIVENEPCERSTLEFTFRTLGVDGAHTYLTTECSDASDPDGEVHHYLDGQPVTDPDLTDPMGLTQVVETAREYTGQPDELFSVQLTHHPEPESIRFEYVLSSPTGTGLDGQPCQPSYVWTTEAERTGEDSILTPCAEEKPPSEWQDSFEADLFDPEVLADLWDREVGTPEPDDRPWVKLGKFEKWDAPRYSVAVGDVVRFFDLAGNPLN